MTQAATLRDAVPVSFLGGLLLGKQPGAAVRHQTTTTTTSSSSSSSITTNRYPTSSICRRPYFMSSWRCTLAPAPARAPARAHTHAHAPSSNAACSSCGSGTQQRRSNVNEHRRLRETSAAAQTIRPTREKRHTNCEHKEHGR